MSLQLNDFQKQDVTFDINKLKEACDQVLKVKGFDTSLGIPHFASISLNQIPGDPKSIIFFFLANFERILFFNLKPA